ncbi:hypothetical protein TorRG33x02_211460 [Trema orientale]|uniref:Uncharacterized protein n=1 Tax=Trema orientale TaxID=63057 RepID=A0A2P5EBW1_TREOI|nr:hypothetical protein TorRG33x02_211460 [Trema orientale]
MYNSLLGHSNKDFVNTQYTPPQKIQHGTCNESNYNRIANGKPIYCNVKMEIGVGTRGQQSMNPGTREDRVNFTDFSLKLRCLIHRKRTFFDNEKERRGRPAWQPSLGVTIGAPTPFRNISQDPIGQVATTGRWSESPEPQPSY